MPKEPQGQRYSELKKLGLQFSIGLVLLFATTYLMNQFEVATRLPVEGWTRSIVILVICVLVPGAFLHLYEVRRRA